MNADRAHDSTGTARIDATDERSPATAPRALRRLKPVLTLGGVALLVGLIVWVGPAAFWDRLRHVDAADLAGATAAIVVGTLVSAVNSYLITGASAVMRFFEFLRAFWIAWAVGLAVPGQVGDVLTLTHVLRRRGMPLSQSMARTGADKVVSLICTLALATQLFRLADTAALRSLSLGAAVLLAGVVVGVAASVSILHAMRRRHFGNRWILGAISTAAEFARIVRVRPGLLATNALLSLVKIALTGISYWLVIRGLAGSAPALPHVTIAAVSSGLVAYLPLSANGIGTVEAAGTGIFGALGLAADVVLPMYVLLRLANIVLAWIPAIFVLPDVLHRRRSED